MEAHWTELGAAQETSNGRKATTKKDGQPPSGVVSGEPPVAGSVPRGGGQALGGAASGSKQDWGGVLTPTLLLQRR